MVVVGIILTSYAINFVVPFPEKDDFVTIIQKAFIIREVIRTGKIPMVSSPKMRTVLIGLHGKIFSIQYLRKCADDYKKVVKNDNKCQPKDRYSNILL